MNDSSEPHALTDDCRRAGIPVTQRDFADYLRDESRFRGHASGVIRPRSEADVAWVMTQAYRRHVPITAASGRTSLTGGPVPEGGLVLDLRGLDFLDSEDPTRVGPGVILEDYKRHIAAFGLFYPPDPTSEHSCTLGGNVACNASGALSYLYGPTREYIRGLNVVLPTGELLVVDRGDVLGRSGTLTIPASRFRPPRAHDMIVPLPRTPSTPWDECKNSAGLFNADPLDLVDLFIGSEGILGVITEVRTRLLPQRRPVIALMIALPSPEALVNLVGLLDSCARRFLENEGRSLRNLRHNRSADERSQSVDLPERFHRIVPACMEWFERSVARFLSPGLAGLFEGQYGALFVEQEYPETDDPFEIAGEWGEFLEWFGREEGIGSGDLRVEVAMQVSRVRRLREERLAVPERLNESIHPGMVKIGTDFSVPKDRLASLLELYRDRLPAGKSYVFGHVGNAHLHANLVPESEDEAARFKAIVAEPAREICAMGGSVSGEHGIGKLKREALRLMVGEDGVESIREIKRRFDPQRLLNPGTMIP